VIGREVKEKNLGRSFKASRGLAADVRHMVQRPKWNGNWGRGSAGKKSYPSRAKAVMTCRS